MSKIDRIHRPETRPANMTMHRGHEIPAGAEPPTLDECREQIAQMAERVNDPAIIRRCWRILLLAYNRQ